MVEELWRYLVKSAQGESLGSLSFDVDGVRRDRSWACIDTDGIVVSAKQPRRWGGLLQVSAWACDDGVLVQVPGGSAAVAGTAGADLALSSWLGATVTLSRTVPAGARLHRLFAREEGMRPSWATSSEEDTVTAIAGARPGGRFVDFGAVHVVTTADLDQLRSDGAPDAEIRRFRPNLVLSLDRALLPGDQVRLSGGVELKIILPTPRCAIPGAAQPGIAEAPGVLRAVGRRRTTIPGFGTAACVGVYADVVRPGLVSTGELASLSSP
jgi:uncharacterized protein